MYQNRLRWGRNRNADGEPPEEPVIVVISQHELRMFILRVYLCAFILCLLSAIPWICLSALKVKVIESIPVPPYVWIILSFILLTILSCIPETPTTRYLCWALVLGSLIFVTLFGCYFAAILPVLVLAGAMAVAIALLGILHLYGALAPRVLLPNLICTCAVVLLGSIALFVLLMLVLFTHEPRFSLASAIVFFIIVCFLAPFQASYICGRLQQVPYGEIASCSNGIYMHFFFLTVCLVAFVVFGG